MIWESHYWKSDLLKRAAALRRWMRQKRWSGASHARFEQYLMLGFYSIRKLIEARKLSNSVVDQQISLIAYPPLGKPVTFMNWHNLDELFDLDSGTKITKDLRYICNQFIHSYIFLPVFGEDNRLCQVIVASDFERNRSCYEIDLNRIITVFEQVGSDYPNESITIFNSKRGDYDVWQTMHTESYTDEAPHEGEESAEAHDANNMEEC